MSVERRKRVKRDWVSVFKEYSRSGMTVKAFCQNQGISPSLFYRRHRDIKNYTDPGKPSLKSNDFIQLPSAFSSSPSMSIIFPGPIELNIHNNCDRKLLEDIINQLKVSSC